MSTFFSEPQNEIDKIIHKSTIYSLGAGSIPLPLLDVVALITIQVDMISKISKIYQVDFKENEVKNIIAALSSSALTKIGSKAFIKMIPVIGPMLGGVSMSVFSAASTYALGQVFKTHFETGGDLLHFNLDKFKNYYDDQFEKGKEYASKTKEEKQDQGKDDENMEMNQEWVSKLKDLHELKEAKIISSAEFEELKSKLIQDILNKKN